MLQRRQPDARRHDYHHAVIYELFRAMPAIRDVILCRHKMKEVPRTVILPASFCAHAAHASHGHVVYVANTSYCPMKTRV